MRSLVAMYQRIGLVPLIIIGLVLGVLIGWLAPTVGMALGLLGTLFVGALKAVAPILVFTLVMAAICQHRSGSEVYVKPVLIMYIFGTFLAIIEGFESLLIDILKIQFRVFIDMMQTNLIEKVQVLIIQV